MRTMVLSLILFLPTALPVFAESDDVAFHLGPDTYAAGRSVAMTEAGRDDVFLAGETLRLGASVTGSAHLAGRYLEVAAPVGGSVYAAGQEISLGAEVAGDATLAAREVDVIAPVAGDLRAFAQEIEVTAPVGETAMLTGETLFLDAAIAGDVAIAAENVTWGERARIDGRLTMMAEDGKEITVPDRVIAADRVEILREETEEWRRTPGTPPERVGGWLRDNLQTAAMLLVGTVGLALIAPVSAASLGDAMLDRPWRMLGLGILGEAVILGLILLLAVTLIGLLAAPFLAALAVIAMIAGQLVGAYGLGRWATEKAGAYPAREAGERVIAAAAGVALVTLITFVPFAGWLFVLGLGLAGLGTLVEVWVRPSFQI